MKIGVSFQKGGGGGGGAGAYGNKLGGLDCGVEVAARLVAEAAKPEISCATALLQSTASRVADRSQSINVKFAGQTFSYFYLAIFNIVLDPLLLLINLTLVLG